MVNLRSLDRRVRGMIRRFVLTSAGNEGAQMVGGRGLDEDFDEAELVQPYGFRSRPRPGADGVTLAAGGTPDNAVALVYDRRDAPEDLEEGDVDVYSHAGNRVHLQADGTIVVENADGASVKIEPGANGDMILTTAGTGKIKIGGAGANEVLALHDELKSMLTDIVGILGTLQAKWATLALVAWPADGALLQGTWTGLATLITTTLPAKLAAATGSPKGRG